MKSLTDYELIALAQGGSVEARNTLIERHLGFIYARTMAYCHNRDAEEFIADATLGFIRAIEKFEPHRGLKLLTYADHWIRQKVYKGYAEVVQMVHIPDYLRESSRKINESCKTDAQRARSWFSLDRDKGPALAARRRSVRHEEAPFTDIRALAQSLPPRHFHVIKMRLNGKMLREIGALTGITRQRVLQIEQEAVQIMRAYARAQSA